MNLIESRRKASELSGGTSPDVVKQLVLRILKEEGAGGHLLDFGAGKGELLQQLAAAGTFDSLAGADLFPRPDGLPDSIAWFQADLNEQVAIEGPFDVILSSETIEHLENPRHVFRTLERMLKPGGLLVLTTPNQESLRSYLGLLLGGHFTHFLGASYPAHITALLRLDLVRMCAEVGLEPPRFRYTDSGGLPKRPRLRWQKVSLGLLRGRLFSDNLAMVTRKRGAG